MDDLQALAYFSSINYISRKIALPEKSLIKYLGDKWSDYSPDQKEELLDDLCVPHVVRETLSCVADDDSALPSCWPTLKLPSGEKIIVDENDIWTWRDEHSGPFSWKSKSQQDLRLSDLESENLTKPHSKGHKSSESEEPVSPTLPTSRQHQFLFSHDSWTQPVLDDFSENYKEEIQTPVHGPISPFSVVENPSEEVNPAFEGSAEDLSPTKSLTHVMVSQPHENRSTEILTTVQETSSEVQANSKGNLKDHKSPSPKKLGQPGPVKKDGKGPGGKLAIDSSQQLLIINNREEEGNSFTNPVMEVEWSNFVGQSSTDPDDEVSPQARKHVDKAFSVSPPLSDCRLSSVNEPPAMVMDRGSIRVGEDSPESTPDHTTQLLNPTASAAVIDKEEKEEVVYVVDDGAGEFSVSSKLVDNMFDRQSSVLEVDNAAASPDHDDDIPRSGFDFLDNW